MTYDAIIIGGGPAGCTAAVEMAGRGFRVLLLEKQRYPVHKLCGEFLSVEVHRAFVRLGVAEAIVDAGAHPITRLYAASADGTVFEVDLPGRALGLSRFRLDPLLMRQARSQGAEVREGTSVTSVEGNLEDGFRVHTTSGSFGGRVVFGAYGKRGVLDRKLDRPFFERREPLVAFKAHYAGEMRPHTVELHAIPGGYCGLTYVEDGRVNVCWISDVASLRAAGGSAEAMVGRVFRENRALGRRFAGLHRISDAFLSVSQVSLAEKDRFDGDLCMIGDAAGMIAPLCGDGMAMALHAAMMAADSAAAFLDGRLTAAAFRATYRRDWNAAFGFRLRLGRWMQGSYRHPFLIGIALRILRSRPGLGRWLIRKTRGEPAGRRARGYA